MLGLMRGLLSGRFGYRIETSRFFFVDFFVEKGVQSVGYYSRVDGSSAGCENMWPKSMMIILLSS